MSEQRVRTVATLAIAALVFVAADARAQVSYEVRGGANVPTFDIADVADPGPSFGLGFTVPIGERLSFRGAADFGFHGGEEVGGVEGPDVNVYHYIAGLELDVIESTASPWTVSLNAGAGAMTFDVDEVDTFTYPAINVGAKATYAFSRSVAFLVSAQGDIAFSDDDEIGTSDAWVWPFSIGVEITP